MLLDGSDSNTATVAQGYAERIVQEFAVRFGGGAQLAVVLRERAWFNPDLASRNYNVPAVAGAIIFLVCLLLTSLAVVREREIGTLEQLMVSPLASWELIAGKTIPFALISLVDMAIVTVAALLWFEVPLRGSFLLLVVASVLFILVALGIGLLISTISKTQQEAFLTTFLVFMPTILLSGLMFPVSSMPELFQWLTLANPMRHYLEIVRGIFLKGTGVAPLWSQYLTLLVLGIGILVFAASRFRKRIG
jgi:ABC-2 type transport system permease protein